MNRSTLPWSRRPVYVVDGCRTPFLKVTGPPGPFRASDLATAVGRQLLLRMPFPPEALDAVVFGCVSFGPDEANIGRVAALRMGCDVKTPAMTVQRNCASGLQAVETGALEILHGRADLVLAGGTEAMSHHPVMLGEAMVTWLARWNRARGLKQRLATLARLRPAHLAPVVALLRGLTDPVTGLTMGQTAEELAERFDIRREAMDRFALRSHQRLLAAEERGVFDGERIPLYDQRGKVHGEDTGLRPDTSLEALARLKPVFDRPVGRITAGNSAQVTDGAACLLLASEEAVEQHRLPVLGRILDSQWAGLDPAIMGLGPVHAMAPIMERQGLDSGDIDYWEINEAFAAQVLACLSAWTDERYCRQTLGLDAAFGPIAQERLNVDGGAIALGHPVGASGARIVLHLLHTLRQHRARRGVAALCIGGGQGGAMLVEHTQTP